MTRNTALPEDALSAVARDASGGKGESSGSDEGGDSDEEDWESPEQHRTINLSGLSDRDVPHVPFDRRDPDDRLPDALREAELAKLPRRARNPTSASGGHCFERRLVFELSPGRETEPGATGPRGLVRGPKGQRERPTGHPRKGGGGPERDHRKRPSGRDWAERRLTEWLRSDGEVRTVERPIASTGKSPPGPEPSE